ncbi:hypothetical protein [Catenuloplanes japonicus]|uniref:hypothetical protein n=1 Tax=Catenuloplanes japonicus TaxID=33876 RepID=UPI0005264FF2|nr:hypothetical protein [Catenuloplanes japonicus]
MWLLAATTVAVATAAIAQVAARRLSHKQIDSRHVDTPAEPDPAVLRQLAWLAPRLTAVRAQSARPEHKAVVLGTFAVATLTGALAVVIQYGLPTHPITRALALALAWAALAGLTLHHLGNVAEATIDIGEGFLADALPPAAIFRYSSLGQPAGYLFKSTFYALRESCPTDLPRSIAATV